MNTPRLLASLAVAALAAGSSASAASIVLTNASFENASGYNGNPGVLLGWTGSSSFGNVFVNTDNSLFTSGVDGNNVIHLNGRIKQATAATFVEGVTYTLTMSMGHALTDTAATGGVSFGFFQDASNSFITGSGQSFVGEGNLPVAGTMGTFSVVYTATAADAGKVVTIGATDFFSGTPTYRIDNFILKDSTTSAVPEPSTYAALVGLGTLGFVALRRRR